MSSDLDRNVLDLCFDPKCHPPWPPNPLRAPPCGPMGQPPWRLFLSQVTHVRLKNGAGIRIFLLLQALLGGQSLGVELVTMFSRKSTIFRCF